MFWTAGCALALNLICQHALAGSALPLAPEAVAGACLIVRLVAGSRAGLVSLPAAWAILAAGGVHADRLAHELSGQDIVLEGVVCSFPRRSGRVVRFVVKTRAGSNESSLPGRLYVGWYDRAIELVPGELWRLEVRLRRPRGSVNPGAFDFERWAYVRGIGATGYVRASKLNSRIGRGRGCALTSLRYQLSQRIRQALGEGAATGYVIALAVGAREWLTESDWTLLRKSGTAHLLAISGLHIGLVAGMALFMARLIGRALLRLNCPCRPLSLSRVCALLAATAYAAMAGFSVPTLRALVMLTVVLTLGGLCRSWSGLAVLGAALYAVLFIEPSAPITSGFWLSFVAVAVLMLNGLQTRVVAGEAAPNLGQRMQQLLNAQCTIFVGLGPLTVLFFAQLSWVAPLINLIVVPLFALVVVPLVFFGVLLLVFNVSAAGIVLSGAALIIAAFIDVVERVIDVFGAVWVPPPMPAWSLIVAVVCALLLILPRPLIGRMPLLAALIPLVFSRPHFAPPAALRLVILDVGHGLAVLVHTPGYALLYDAGPAFGSRDAGQTVVIPALRHFGVRQLDAIVLSHPDADHVGGLRSVLAEYPAPVMATSMGELAGVANSHFERCAMPRRWVRDGVVFRVLGPAGSRGDRHGSDNDLSCVLLVEFDGFRILLPGDIERAGEANLLAGATLPPIDVLIAPHHGSRTSSGPAFVTAVAPELVVYSTDHANRWGFPDPEVVARWDSVSRCQLSTAQSGAITINIAKPGAAARLHEYRTAYARIWSEPITRSLPCRKDATN